SLTQILLRRETIEREEFLGLLDGLSEEEAFRARDEKARRLAEEQAAAPPPPPRERPSRIPLPPPAPEAPAGA
ncbi:MAG: hypothetical protein MUE51_14670, partial [Thermoleophilia bacterium]|nr:hypothetical protein [Thermoleophilia bacterium]